MPQLYLNASGSVKDFLALLHSKFLREGRVEEFHDPEFQKFWDKDAKMLAAAIKRVGKIETK